MKESYQTKLLEAFAGDMLQSTDTEIALTDVSTFGQPR